MAKANMDLFAANLQYLMRRLDLTGDELADLLKMKYPRIKAWVNGKTYPAHEAMVQLCQVLGYYDIFKMLTEKITL
ncbi:MAG TPA: helix-turn-helix transcriptional regulator [Puia sp.]|jgi:transcriptional regulator with XRE-family HTH domain